MEPPWDHWPPAAVPFCSLQNNSQRIHKLGHPRIRLRNGTQQRIPEPKFDMNIWGIKVSAQGVVGIAAEVLVVMSVLAARS
jgi:hypothetical protein